MQNRWKTKQAAYGETIILLAVGALITYLKPCVGIPIDVLLIIVGIVLVWRAHKHDKLVQQPRLQCAIHTRNVLWKLHKRDLKLEKQTFKQYSRLFKSSDFRQLLTEFMNTTIFVPNKEKLAKVTKKIGSEKLSNDKVKRREQVDMVTDKVHRAVKQEWTLEKNECYRTFIR